MIIVPVRRNDESTLVKYSPMCKCLRYLSVCFLYHFVLTIEMFVESVSAQVIFRTLLALMELNNILDLITNDACMSFRTMRKVTSLNVSVP